MSTYICTQCYEGICSHANNIPCKSHAYNQDCGCTKGNGMTLLPDYESNIPEHRKSLTFSKLVELLNKETSTWDKTSYKIKFTAVWRWATDYAAYEPTAITLVKNNSIDLGALEENFEVVQGEERQLINFIPYDDCTIYDVRFIREITGWDIKI